MQAAGKDEIAFGGLVVTVEEAWGVPSASSCTLAGIELRVTNDAACLMAEIMAGPRSLAVRVIRDANVARMIAAGLGTIFDAVGNCSLRTR